MALSSIKYPNNIKNARPYRYVLFKNQMIAKRYATKNNILNIPNKMTLAGIDNAATLTGLRRLSKTGRAGGMGASTTVKIWFPGGCRRQPLPRGDAAGRVAGMETTVSLMGRLALAWQVLLDGAYAARLLAGLKAIDRAESGHRKDSTGVLCTFPLDYPRAKC